MYTKKERISSWQVMAILCILLSGVVEMIAELYLPGGWFNKIAAFLFACGALLGVANMFLSSGSLAVNDWHESQTTKTFVNLGHDNDRVISVRTLQDAILHLPVAGTVHQAIIAPSKADVPYVVGETLEHVHFGNQIPKVEVMDDELYQKLFGSINKKEK